ncbi:MAG: elongation factor 1-beta [Nitrososphaerales archaeon]
MSKLILRFKVMPSDSDVDFKAMEKEVISRIPKDVKLNYKREEPIAFGLKALILDLECEEKDGVSDEIENLITGSEMVGRAELIGVSRKSITVK